MKKDMKKRVDAVVIGSGPGGAAVARGLARAGKSVVLLEKGRDQHMLGNHAAALGLVDHCGLRWSDEGVNIIRGVTTGGSSVIYTGSAADPPSWLAGEFGVDLAPQVARLRKELKIGPLPEWSLGGGSFKIMDAACELGYDFSRLDKFMDPNKCRTTCGGTCMLGCPHGAKWTAREYIIDMQAAGGELITRANAQQVLSEGGKASGVLAFTPVGKLWLEAETVVVAAGGLGSAAILQKSGLHQAGREMFVDPLVLVTAVSPGEGTCHTPPMSVGTYQLEGQGIMLADLIDPWGMWLLMTGKANFSRLRDFIKFRRQLGVMVKVGDEMQGAIAIDERVSKPLTQQDRHRLNKGAAIARDILIKAGCDAETVIVGPVRGSHPGGTAAIGRVVDQNLATEIDGLYVCDASVLPRSMDRPMVLTILALAERLLERLAPGRER